LLNNYYEATIRCIHQTDGTVVDIIGDAIFAIWNAPEAQADHKDRMVQAALLFQQNLKHFNSGQGNMALRTRVGLHTGEVVVGNVGSSEHFDYTAIGENVNLSSRLEGLNKHLGTDVLMTREAIPTKNGQWILRDVGRFLFKGFEKVAEVTELLVVADGSSEKMRPWLDSFANALQQFQKRNFAAAEEGFKRTIELRGDDGPSKFYLKQIAEMQQHPVPDDWTGDTEMKEK
jgi:adenylate cyclase